MSTTGMLSPSMIDAARSRAIANMPDTAALYSPVSVTDPKTKVTSTTYPTVASTERCRLDSLTAEERVIAEQEGERVDGVLKLPAETPIGHRWRAVVSGVYPSGVAWSQTYEAVGVDAPQSYEIERRVRVRAVRSGTA